MSSAPRYWWDVTVCTRGGHQSWNGLVKRLDPSGYDFLFVLVGDGRRWFIPSAEGGGGCRIRPGGPRYAQFEIEPARPLVEPSAGAIPTGLHR